MSRSSRAALRMIASVDSPPIPESWSSSVCPMIEVRGVLSSWLMVAMSSPL